MTRVLLTGASGFIGQALSSHLLAKGYQVSAIGRTAPTSALNFFNGELSDTALVAKALEGAECVVHLAARAHQLSDGSARPLDDFRAVNRDLSLVLAAEAARAGVRRFVFVSSIGVNGASSGAHPFAEEAVVAPHSDYALSKWEAEQALQEHAHSSGMEVTILRPPLVYGCDAPGNFARLLRLVALGLPLPFASVHNKRSMIALENLVTLIEACMSHPKAANELFLASDGDDFSIGEIIRLLAQGMGREAHLWPVPVRWLSAGASLLGRTSQYVQLCESLQVDASKSRRLLEWQPCVSAQDALLLAGQRYAAHAK